MSSDDWSDFDDLLADAQAAIAAKRKPAKRAAPLPEDLPAAGALFCNPANWERVRGVALVHAESETLLGNFSEYRHKTVPRCRKLIREEAPLAVSAVERVSGSWWLGESVHPEPRQAWHTSQHAIVHLHLGSLAVHAPATEVVAFLSYGSIARVELYADTRFAGEDGVSLLDLPKGTNVLGEMTQDSKIALRVELAL